MADIESNSSQTSTSHTMSALPPSPLLSQVPVLPPNSNILDWLAPDNRHHFITPTSAIVDASLKFTKDVVENYAGKLADEQEEKLRELRKRKREKNGEKVAGQALKIRKIHTQGFEVDTIWEQARRVIDALRRDVEKNIEELEAIKVEKGENSESVMEPQLSQIGKDGDENEHEEYQDSLDEDTTTDSDAAEEDLLMDTDDENGDSDRNLEESEEFDDKPTGIYHADPHGLNDGFFSIDEFNKHTEMMERLNTTENPFSGDGSEDEEEIDWDADPSKKVSGSLQKSSKFETHDDSEEDEDEVDEGPTFGNMDLDAPLGESDNEDDEAFDTIEDNTNDIMYKDFFEPPPKKIERGQKQTEYLQRQQRKPKVTEPEDEDASLERAMADVRRDLFEDESDDGSSDDNLPRLDPSDPKSRKSVHERKQAKLAEEIRRLESASVAKREWTLAGEARAADRPLNSLLEEDLDFERTGKPVLEVTAEVSESIEELIKRRILAQEFDEVIKRRPDDLIKTTTRRGVFELDDNKPSQSLAEIYEEEHVKANNPDVYISKADEKLRNDEKEIEILWKDVSAKLDALSSWYYKPKPPAPSLTVVSDVATIAIEDAQPTTASGINGSESMLAPQEIYKAGQDKQSIEKGEVVLKSGAPIARQEMTREEKLRRRRRAKERILKRGGVDKNQLPESQRTKRNKETFNELKKGGVKVIGKKGDVRNLEGKKVEAQASITGAGSFKL
ncbi:hypothetical protein K3495_g5624 [Podosphaera aphanis]|nr:hypothetical protein K3495_g5624 [Podosphaera aphanis]